MLRKSVLWPRRSSSPPNMELAEDGKGHHFGAFIGGRVYPVAVISLWKQPEPLPEPPESSTSSDRPEEVGANSTKGVTAVRFDHFAVESEFQRHGIGSALLRHAFQVAQDSLGADVIWCTASLVAVNYYRKHEMEVCAPTLLKGPSLYFTPMRIVLSGERNDGALKCILRRPWRVHSIETLNDRCDPLPSRHSAPDPEFAPRRTLAGSPSVTCSSARGRRRTSLRRFPSETNAASRGHISLSRATPVRHAGDGCFSCIAAEQGTSRLPLPKIRLRPRITGPGYRHRTAEVYS